MESDTELLFLVTSVMLGRFHGPNLLLEVVQNTLMWNVTVSLSLLYIVFQQILLKKFSHHNEDKACFPRCMYIFTFLKGGEGQSNTTMMIAKHIM